MARLNYLIICEEVVVDKTTQKISVVNIFNSIGANELPARPNKFVVAFDFCPEDGDVSDDTVHVKIKIVPPSKKHVFSITGTGTFTKPPVKSDDTTSEIVHHLNLADKLGVHEFGTHKVQLFVADKKIGERSLKIVPAEEITNES